MNNHKTPSDYAREILDKQQGPEELLARLEREERENAAEDRFPGQVVPIGIPPTFSENELSVPGDIKAVYVYVRDSR